MCVGVREDTALATDNSSSPAITARELLGRLCFVLNRSDLSISFFLVISQICAFVQASPNAMLTGG